MTRVDGLARLALLVMVAAVALGLVGGLLTAATGPAVSSPTPAGQLADDERCPQPPCFGLDFSDIPPREVPGALLTLLQMAGFGLAIVLGVPSLLAGVWHLARGRAISAGLRLLAFVGPVLVLVVTEALPHALLPCGVLPGVCEDVPGHGWGVTGQWHQLDHVLVGALPGVALYRLALRRWHPALHTQTAPLDDEGLDRKRRTR